MLRLQVLQARRQCGQNSFIAASWVHSALNIMCNLLRRAFHKGVLHMCCNVPVRSFFVSLRFISAFSWDSPSSLRLVVSSGPCLCSSLCGADARNCGRVVCHCEIDLGTLAHYWSLHGVPLSFSFPYAPPPPIHIYIYVCVSVHVYMVVV